MRKRRHLPSSCLGLGNLKFSDISMLVVVKLLSLVQLFCNPMDYSPPGSLVHGISQARLLKWVAISFSRGSSCPRDQTASPTLASGFFTTEPPGNLESMLINFKKNPPNLPKLSSRIFTPRVKLKVLKQKFLTHSFC